MEESLSLTLSEAIFVGAPIVESGTQWRAGIFQRTTAMGRRAASRLTFKRTGVISPRTGDDIEYPRQMC